MEVEMSKNRTPLWREAHFEVNMYKNTPAPDHFWKLRCRKSARHYGAKRIWKSKCAKHTSSGPLLEVEMLKSACRCGAKHISKSKCIKLTIIGPLLEVEMSKSTRCCGAKHISKLKCTKRTIRTTFGGLDLEKVYAVVVRSIFRS